jgi:hypothetical protein
MKSEEEIHIRESLQRLMRKNQQDISTSLDNLFDDGENALPLSHLSSTNYIPISLPVTVPVPVSVQLDPVPPQWTRIGELLKQLKELHHIAALLQALPRLSEPGQG